MNAGKEKDLSLFVTAQNWKQPKCSEKARVAEGQGGKWSKMKPERWASVLGRWGQVKDWPLIQRARERHR